VNPSAQAMPTLQSGSTLAVYTRRLASGLRNQAGTVLRKRPWHRGKFLGRLGSLGSLTVAMTCGVAQAQSLITTLPGTVNPVATAVNQTTNTVYVADGIFAQMVVVNGAANTATTIQPGGPFGAIAVNPTTNTLYALKRGSKTTPGSVVVIDGTTNTATTTIGLPSAAGDIAVNPVTNQIFVSDLNNVAVIDGSTNAITANISVPQGISSLAVDTTRNVVWVMYGPGSGNSTLAAIDGATNAVTATVVVGYGDTAFALNTTTNTIYVPDAHGTQLYVIAGATVTITATVKWPNALSSSGLAIDPVTDTIYVPASNMNSGLVDVMDGSTNTITTSISVPTPQAPIELLVNSVTNEIWVISGNPVVVIDGATKKLTIITGTYAELSGALNTATNTGYIAGPQNIFVISGGAGTTSPAFSASPSPLAFGNQSQGTTSSAMTLTVTNTGNANLTITTVTAGGTNMSDFIIGADTCSNATVAAKSTCTVSVDFDPSTTARESATLTFADNASGSPQTVTLTGTGVAPVPTATTTTLSASATPVAVGTSVVLTATVIPASGTPTPTGTVTFDDGANTLGTGTLNGSSVATYSTSSFAMGSHSITASYGGDARNTGSTSNTITVNVTATAAGLQFIPVTPCRVADTRNATGPFGGPILAAATTREFDIPQSSCGIPSTAVAYSLNVTVVPSSTLNYLSMWPSGLTQPYVSTLNSDGRVKANAAITPAGTNGGVDVFVSDATHVILDIDGYFVPAGTASGLAFYPVTPCRVSDTRSAAGPLGGPFIAGNTHRDIPVQSSNCGIPANAQAYSLNVTAIPHSTLNYLTAWGTGQTQPYVSTLNSSTGAVAANAAIVPGASNGDVSIFVSDDADVILDVNGYFAAPATSGLSLYTTTPCRIIDTRSLAGAFNGTLVAPVQSSSCAPPSSALAYVLNATVVPSGSLNYLSLWPDSQAQPYVSTLNARDGTITSNMAIVPNVNGKVDVFSSDPTNVILDISSYFAP
jgi:DNA-binding beta-propeller fold protein YncE